MSYTARAQRAQGWMMFAAIVLMTSGVMRIIDAIWAFDKDDEVGEDLQVLLFEKDLAAYGWLWLAVGALLIAAGFGVLRGATWARWVGIVAAAFAAISAMLWIYLYPIGSFLYVALAVMVIHGLTADGFAEET